MALHAKLLKHNLLRVSKLKKLSHTTQAIERNFDRCAPGFAFTRNVAKDRNEADKQTSDLLPVLQVTSQLGQDPPTQWSALDLQELVTLPPTQQSLIILPDKATVITTCHVDSVSAGKLKDKEGSLTTVLFPQNCWPALVKPVSYTTEDLVVCPADRENHHHDHSIICYENHAVTIVTDHEHRQWSGIDSGIDLKAFEDVQPCVTSEEDVHKHLQHKIPKRHSICDSNSAQHQAHLTDSLLCCSGCDSDSASFTAPSGSDNRLCSAGPGTGTVLFSTEGPKSSGAGGDQPNLDQLKSVETYFIESLPTFFKSRLDYRVYHPEIVFENNFWGENKVAVGINQYAVEMTKMRALTHLKYAHVHMDVVSSTCLPEEAVVQIHWRIVGLSQLKALRFWKYTAWSYSKSFREDAEWIDGISILHINKDGLVTKHRIDRMTPDEEQAVKAPNLATKLALLLGLSAPKPSMSDFSSLLFRR